MSFKKKIERVKALDENILLVNLEESRDPNFTYLTGMESRTSFMWIPKDKDPIVITHEMESRRLEDIPYEVEVTDSIFEKVNSLVTGEKFGINGRIVPYNLGSKLDGNVFDISEELSKVREIKTKDEIEKITKAQRLAERIFKNVSIEEGMREIDIAKKINIAAIREGVETSFETISAGGVNASSPHHTFSRDKIKGVFYLDWGIRNENYCSDCTRSLVFSKKYEEPLNKISEAIKSVEDVLKPGVKASEMHNLAVEKLGKYSDKFIHSLGHGIGIQVHEGPSLSPKSEDTIEEGMVFTVEPGIYADKWGLRIENMYVMTKKGAKRITKLPNILG